MLVATSHPGNVGASARAMRVMGLRELVLVAPRDAAVASHPDAIARASGAADVLERACVVDTLEQALAPCTLAVAVSAEAREFGPPPRPPEEIVARVFAEMRADPAARVAFVFGSERNGLSIDEVGQCHWLCSIPGGDDYASLNLSQAVQIVAYCLRAHDRSNPSRPAAEGGPAWGAPDDAKPVAAQRFATHAQLAALYEHLERALVRIAFLDPRHPKKLMPRLRRLFSRTRLEVEEVALLRGVCTQIEKACVDPYAAARAVGAAARGASRRAESE